MSRIIGISFFLGIIFLLDLYTYGAVKTVSGNKTWVRNAYWAMHILFYVSFFTFFIAMFSGVRPNKWIFFYLSLVLSFYIPKLVIVPVLGLEDAVRGVRALFGWMGMGESTAGGNGAINLSRQKFISQFALGLAAIPFAASIYGVLKGKYDYKVRKVKLTLKNLPKAFEGLTITQISDIHVGSFENKAAVQRGVDLIKAQNSDMVFFTGDLINNYIDEMQGWEEVFSQIQAPMGVFSVLGNHDYSEYVPWPSKEAWWAHLDQVKAMHGKLGWNLLLNQNRIIERNGEKLAIIGIENWGHGFSKHGKLNEAVIGTENVPVKLLLSHDPSHWEAQVIPNYPDITAAFAGHTHGMQLGVEIGDFKWSPSQWRYTQWAGLYQEGDQFIYVNRGFGFLGFSGRIGIMPEITVFELASA